jgi:prolyl-tRNA synthetase
MARAEVGEDRFVECENGDYLADWKAATPLAPDPVDPGASALGVVDTPGAATIEDVARFLGRPPSQMLKTMIYDAGGRSLAVLVPGDREVEEAKLERAFFPTPIRRLEDDEFAARGLVKGYVGPQGLGPDIEIVADHSVRAGVDWVAGANEPDRHATGVNAPRDFRVDRFEDDAGMTLPRELAPFEAVIVVANRDVERVVAAAEGVYDELLARGVDVAIDDREQAAGVKFNDADLVGYPVQVVVGRRGVEAGTVDLKLRATGERSSAPLADAAGAVVDLLASAP